MTASTRWRRWLPPLLAAGVLLAAACGSSGQSGDDPRERSFPGWSTDTSMRTIELDELTTGQVKDGIPAIDEPRFVATSEGDSFLGEREPVVVVEVNDDARAYPLQIMIWHEIVNDVVGGEPVAVTFCPLCNSAIAFERDLDGVVYDFGTSGMLRNSDLVMYDRQTESWWQQFTGEAIVGELVGTRLDALPASIVSWADFRSTYPDGKVLSRDTGFSRDYGRNPYTGYDTTEDAPFLFRGEPDGRLPPVERVVAVELNGEAAAYPFSALEKDLVVSDSVGGEPIVVFFQPGTASALDSGAIADSRDVGASGVFAPEAGERPLTFRAEGGEILDNETGSRWNVLGKALDGPLAGAELPPVVHGDHFWFAWAAFKPDTRIYAGGG